MNVIVSGGRDKHLTPAREKALLAKLEELQSESCEGPLWNDLVVFVGGCEGIDAEVKEALQRRGIHCSETQALWDFARAQGRPRSAGPIRNRAQACAAGPDAAVILFPGNKGTNDMREQAVKRGMKIVELT